MRKRILFVLLLISIFLSNCAESIRNQSDGNNCFVYGQINYILPGYVEEGLRDLVLINLSTNNEYQAIVFPYEKGFVIMGISPGQYAVKSAKWIFLDTKVLSRTGVYRQVTIELKFTSNSYSQTKFEIQKSGVFFAGSYHVSVKQDYIIKNFLNVKLLPLIEKIKDKIKATNWLEGFKKSVKAILTDQKDIFETYLRKKIPGESAMNYESLVDNYINQ